MRVGVIRGDLSGPIFVADLEPTSQVDPVIEHGQTRYLSRPDPVRIQAYLDAQGLGTGGGGLATAAVVIAATNPVGGPINVASGTITGLTGLGAATVTQVAAIADLIAPRFVETDVAQKSFLFGNLHGYLSASFSPDPNRFTTGAAVSVVQDDGVSLFSAQVAVPVITSCHISGGNLQINGTHLAEYGNYAAVKALIVNITGSGAVRLNEKQIALAGGTFSATQIVVPASLVPGIAVTTTTVVLEVNKMVAGPVAIS